MVISFYRIIKKIIFSITIILFIIGTIFLTFDYYWMNDEFYNNEFIKTGTYDRLGFEKTNKIKLNLFNFFLDKEELDYFSKEEVKHWFDVKNIYVIGNKLLIAIFFLLIIFLPVLFLLEKKILKIILLLSRYLIITGIIGVIISIIIIFLLYFTFASTFDIFHLLFFKDNWWFGPGYLCYDTFTQDFFKDISISIFIFSLILFFIYLIGGTTIRILTSLRKRFKSASTSR